MDISRRNFLGILGTSLVAAYVPEWTLDLAPKGAVAPFSFAGGFSLWDITLTWSDYHDAAEPRLVSISRNGATVPLLRTGMLANAFFRWAAAAPDGVIVVPQGQSLSIDPPDERLQWAVIGETGGIACMARGHGDVTDEVCTLEDLSNLGARARRRRQCFLTEVNV